jgi:hypothetical protein
MKTYSFVVDGFLCDARAASELAKNGRVMVLCSGDFSKVIDAWTISHSVFENVEGAFMPCGNAIN